MLSKVLPIEVVVQPEFHGGCGLVPISRVKSIFDLRRNGWNTSRKTNSEGSESHFRDVDASQDCFRRFRRSQRPETAIMSNEKLIDEELLRSPLFYYWVGLLSYIYL
ncbi:uncharacterized protein LOC120285072 [Drosophila simulans]|uniref:uncharacterized protein LOC120285072 n=1 Tax=Drosophila simulans TaxID=7240 RepID=UPI00192CF411|nr:uncharacterized protein LOC120285072 [Drosophila simulans]